MNAAQRALQSQLSQFKLDAEVREERRKTAFDNAVHIYQDHVCPAFNQIIEVLTSQGFSAKVTTYSEAAEEFECDEPQKYVVSSRDSFGAVTLRAQLAVDTEPEFQYCVDIEIDRDGRPSMSGKRYFADEQGDSIPHFRTKALDTKTVTPNDIVKDFTSAFLTHLGETQP